MTTPELGSPLRYWLMDNAIASGDLVQGGDRDFDRSLRDGRTMFAQYYGEAHKESIYDGTEGTVLVGHVHLEGDDQFESFLPTAEGKVLRVVTDKDDGVIEGPAQISPEDELGVIALLDSLILE